MTETRPKLNALLSDYRLAASQVKQEKRELIDADENVYAAEEAQKLIQGVAQVIQQEAHSRIASVVTRCLEAVFDEPYTFNIEFERKRGRTEANLQFVRGGLVIDPLTASGGGVVDVAAFALRLACLVLLRPPVRRIMVMDEPFRFVSSEYRPRVRELIETLASEMGVQFVFVTHIEELRCGKVIELN